MAWTPYVFVTASAFLALGQLANCVFGAGPVVTVASGKLEGVRVAGKGHARNYTGFYGVPFAEPPVGELRYKAPRPPRSWEGIRLAAEEGSVCPQPASQTQTQLSKNKIIGSEDCLYLNVFTPSLPCPAEGLAVIAYIPGGTYIYQSGSAKELFGPDFLVHHDVVLVTMNYRLGALGFLNLNTEGIPGNAGLKDMLAALRWVQQNIHAFCGDPARVTLMGQSAGSKAVSLLSTFKESEGLFRASIELCGNAVGLMAYSEDNEERCREMATRLGAKDQDAASVEAALRTASAEDITRIAWDIYWHGAPWGMSYNPYVPSRELRPPDSEPVLMKEDPEYLLSHSPVPRRPTLTGVESRDCIYDAKYLSSHEDKMKLMRGAFATYLVSEGLRMGADTARELGVPQQLDPARLGAIAQAVKDMYFHGNEIAAEYAEGIADLISDIRYIFPMYRFASQLDNQTAPLYLYIFDVTTDYNGDSATNSSIKGAAHGYDLAYVFRMPNLGDLQDLQDSGLAGKTLRHQVQLITDFAKDLRSPLLPADASQNRAGLPYLYIGNRVSVRSGNTLGVARRMRFWEEVTESLRQPDKQSGGGAGLRSQAGHYMSILLGLLSLHVTILISPTCT